MKRRISVLLVLVVVLMIVGCFGKQTRPTQTKRKAAPLKSCTSHSITYKGSALAVPVVAKKKLNKCATITNLSFTSIDTINTGNSSAFGGVIGKEGMEDWIVFYATPKDNFVMLTVFAPPELVEKVAGLKTNQGIKIKGKFTGNRIRNYSLSTSSAITGAKGPEKVIIFADDIMD